MVQLPISTKESVVDLVLNPSLWFLIAVFAFLFRKQLVKQLRSFDIVQWLSSFGKKKAKLIMESSNTSDEDESSPKIGAPLEVGANPEKGMQSLENVASPFVPS
jgi:hypothetical protein